MEYQIIRSFRKTICIQIKEDGSLLVLAPYFVSEKKIFEIIEKKSHLISKKQQRLKNMPDPVYISSEEVEELRKKAKTYLLPRVQLISEKTGLSYSGVKITSAKGRFGSCNSKGSLCFSLFLMMAEPPEIDYVILHELCHTKEMNHSPRFYSLVSEFMPDYKERQMKLKSLRLPIVLDEKG